MSIYHAFNQTLSQVSKDLPTIKEMGFDRIQLSPMHQFRTQLPHNVDPNTPSDVWWLAYQPTKFEIGNRYGSRQELIDFCAACHSLGIKVIVDVCLNFMASLQGVESKEWMESEKRGNESTYNEYMKRLDSAYPPFNRDDFVFRHYRSRSGQLVFNWYNRSMPALKTGSTRVRRVIFPFLDDLKKCGVDGFRFDAGLYMPTWSLQWYLEKFPSEYNYVEIIERRRLNVIQEYSKLCSIEAFRPTVLLIDAITNDVSLLKQFDQECQSRDVVFSLNHDTYMNSIDGHGIRGLGISLSDAKMANSFLIANGYGVPLILNSTCADTQTPKNAHLFRNSTSNETNTFEVVDNDKHHKNLLFCNKGNKGFFIVNNKDKAIFIKQLSSPSASFDQNLTWYRMDMPNYPITMKEGTFYSNGHKGLRIDPKSVTLYLVQ